MHSYTAAAAMGLPPDLYECSAQRCCNPVCFTLLITMWSNMRTCRVVDVMIRVLFGYCLAGTEMLWFRSAGCLYFSTLSADSTYFTYILFTLFICC